MSAAESLELWLLTGTKHLYGEDEMETVSVQAREIAAALSTAHSMPVPIVPAPAVTTGKALDFFCGQANDSPECIGVIFRMETLDTARLWAAGLDQLRKPFCLVHNQPGLTVPRTGGRPRSAVFVGHHGDPTLAGAISDWARGALGARVHDDLRVAEFADIDFTGPLRSTSESSISSLVEQYQDLYEVDPALGPDGTLHDALREQARHELAALAVLEDGGYQAFTTPAGHRESATFSAPFSAMGLPVQRLMARGYGFAPDGETRTAGLVRVLKTIGFGPGGTTFLEDTVYRRAQSGMTAYGAHVLELCPSVLPADARPRIEAATIGSRSGTPRLVFDIPPGPAVNAGLVGSGTGGRMVANSVQIAAGETDPVSELPAGWSAAGSEAGSVGRAPHLIPHPDLASAAECWRLASAPRFTALTTNVSMHVLETWAEMIGIGFSRVDHSTTVRSFSRSIAEGE